MNIRWGALPEAVPIESERGLKLFEKAHNRIEWCNRTAEGAEADLDPEPAINLYDKEGTAICRAGQFMDYIDGHNVPENPLDFTQTEYGGADEEL